LREFCAGLSIHADNVKNTFYSCQILRGHPFGRIGRKVIGRQVGIFPRGSHGLIAILDS
jgi:hypothetical protein